MREAWADVRKMGVDFGPAAYAADTTPGSDADKIRKTYGVRWRPSIHMPRWASRITLEITEVRAERLQDITEADAMAEGVTVHPDARNSEPHVAGFADLWNTINAARGHGWDTNPWVWAVTFKQVKGN